MKFYNKYFKSNYDELITYYPRYYREIFEMVEILKAHGKIADILEENIERVFLNNFILTADEQTIKIWEEDILNITYHNKLSLKQRKNVIIAMLCGHGHIGEPEIRQIIANYTSNAVSVDFEKGRLFILVDGIIFDEINLYHTLLKRIPAHIGLGISIHIRREFRQELNICYGGTIATNYCYTPISQHIRGKLELPVGYQGVLLSTQSAENANIKYISKKQTQAVGGVYYTTHIKSKLIE